MKNTLILSLFMVVTFMAVGQNKYQKDFDYFWELMEDQYAYFDQKQTQWNKVKELYDTRLQTVTKDWEFTYTIELMKHELYDPHLSLNRNLDFSFRLIPNDSDAYIKVDNGKYYISDIRDSYRITEYKLQIGYQLVKVNGKNIQ